jgi:hypothetical protein
MADLSLREGASMFQAGAGLSSMITQRASAESDLRRSYTSAISGLQQSLAQQVFGAQQGIASAGFETGMARAENIGTGFNLTEAVINTGLSMLASGSQNPGGQTQQTPFQYSSQSYGMGPQGGGFGTISSGGEVPSGYATFNPAYGQGGGYSYQTF